MNKHNFILFPCIDCCNIYMFSLLIVLETYDKVEYTWHGQTLWLILFQCITAKEKKSFMILTTDSAKCLVS